MDAAADSLATTTIWGCFFYLFFYCFAKLSSEEHVWNSQRYFFPFPGWNSVKKKTTLSMWIDSPSDRVVYQNQTQSHTWHVIFDNRRLFVERITHFTTLKPPVAATRILFYVQQWSVGAAAKQINLATEDGFYWQPWTERAAVNPEVFIIRCEWRDGYTERWLGKKRNIMFMSVKTRSKPAWLPKILMHHLQGWTF